MSRWLGKVITLGVVYAILVALLEFYFDIDIPTWVGLLVGGLIGLYMN